MLDIEAIFQLIEPYCAAVYYGGSRVDPVINNPHDYDYICFTKPLYKYGLLQCLRKNNLRATLSTKTKKTTQKVHEVSKEFLADFSQVRAFPYTQITWFSYLDVLMIKLKGEDVCPKTDVIKEHRLEFLRCLYEKATLLKTGKMRNQKRWYHLLRGVYILQNNSYEVTEDQRKEINILHDLSEGWEAIRDKTIKLLEDLCKIEGIT